MVDGWRSSVVQRNAMDNLELSMADVPIGDDDIDVTAVEVPSLESDLVPS